MSVFSRLNTSQLPEKQQNEIKELNTRIQSLSETINHTEDYDSIIKQALLAAHRKFETSLRALSNDDILLFLTDKFEQATKSFFKEHSLHVCNALNRQELIKLCRLRDRKKSNLDKLLQLLRRYCTSEISDNTLMQNFCVLSIDEFSVFIDILNEDSLFDKYRKYYNFSSKLEDQIQSARELESRETTLVKRSTKYEFILQMIRRKLQMELETFKTYFRRDSVKRENELIKVIKSYNSDSVLKLLTSKPTIQEIEIGMKEWKGMISDLRSQLRYAGDKVEKFSSSLRSEREQLLEFKKKVRKLSENRVFGASKKLKTNDEREQETLKRSIEACKQKISTNEIIYQVYSSKLNRLDNSVCLCEDIFNILHRTFAEVNGYSNSNLESSNTNSSPKYKTSYHEKQNCSICLEELDHCNVVSLPCSHTFHSTCIIKWLERKNKCPLCLTFVPSI